MFADDYSYSFSRYTGERISSIKDIFMSQYTHYYTHNGRFVTHSIAELFLLLGDPIFNVINTVAYLFLGYLICYHAIGKKCHKNVGQLILVYCMLFMFTPAFGQSFLWLTGSSNYMFGIIIILLYLIPYRYVAEHKNSSGKFSFLKFVGMTILGFLAGATNENNSIALIAIIIAYLIYFKAIGIKIRFWMIGIGNIIGCLTMLLAPGTKERLDTSGGALSIADVIRRLIFITTDLVQQFYFLFFITVGLLMVYYFCHVKPKKIKLDRKGISNTLFELAVPCIYFFGFLGSVYSMSVSPFFPDRVWSGPLIILIITIISIYSTVRPKIVKNKYKSFQTVVIVLFAFSSICIYCNEFFLVKSVYVENAKRISTIEENVENGESEVAVPAISSNSKYSCFNFDGDLGYDETYWTNIKIAKYYGIDKVIREDKPNQ